MYRFEAIGFRPGTLPVARLTGFPKWNSRKERKAHKRKELGRNGQREDESTGDVHQVFSLFVFSAFSVVSSGFQG